MTAATAVRADKDERLRHELGLLYSEVALEIRRRSPRAEQPGAISRAVDALASPVRGVAGQFEKDAPALALEGLGRLSLALRRLTGRDVIDLNALLEISMFFYRQRELAMRGPNYEVDEFGFDQEWTDSLLPFFRWVYRNYWRVETTGLEHVPSEGRALLVSNHSGVLPFDATMIKTALLEEHPAPRHARALVATFFFQLPVLSWFLRRSGQTVGHPDDSVRLLERDDLVLVFPEGVKGTGKGWRERYKLRRFGRGGFVQVAIRARAPIIPVSVVGAEEIYPMIGNLTPVAKLIGFPYYPITPFYPWLGVLGMIPLPSKWRIQFHPPIRTDLRNPDDANDQNLVMTVSDQVRDTIQRGIYENLKLRKHAYLA